MKGDQTRLAAIEPYQWAAISEPSPLAALKDHFAQRQLHCGIANQSTMQHLTSYLPALQERVRLYWMQESKELEGRVKELIGEIGIAEVVQALLLSNPVEAIAHLESRGEAGDSKAPHLIGLIRFTLLENWRRTLENEASPDLLLLCDAHGDEVLYDRTWKLISRQVERIDDVRISQESGDIANTLVGKLLVDQRSLAVQR